MKKVFLIFVFFLSICLGFYIHLNKTVSIIGNKDKAVFIRKNNIGLQLFRNGKPFYIKGAGGQPYLNELSNAGGNTLRLYDTIQLSETLDKAQDLNLAVIVDIPLARPRASYNPYLKDCFNLKLKNDVRQLVRRYSNHPALLFWNLGNEIRFPLVLEKNEFIRTFNELIDIIHEEDPNHLVGTSVSGTSKKQTLGLHMHAPNLDIIGLNVFGNLKDVKSLERLTSLFFTSKPYYFTEWGIHGPWEEERSKWNVLLELNSTEKAQVIKNRYEDFIKPDETTLGSIVFYWGSKIEGTPTWFNIFDSIGRKSESYYTLKSIWGGKSESKFHPTKIEKFELDGRIAQEKNPLIFQPNQIKQAQIFIDKNIDSTIQFDWKIHKEAWGNQRWSKSSVLNKVLDSLNTNSSNILTFIVPNEEGPYRLFVNIYDKHNNFSTANIPFYVLEIK
ncbi:glycoside hydrolase (GHnc) [Formosa agariphila KMM 3901]|uniref:Glycoside hydrolase (GHnc) n=1 Tax=Formosa agariphila (strain DSM 15362 / KCTC 12365 / LMG 23005 / KMM 3901 / M-2Alg 35-1) TaxID=1347342 RepID=T2KPC5_FORAG|nr:glycoside hydrolase family 2 TIM barrel-domain containing protein [Formosa agariphila]CDF80707.1 glycoside hydrolase (GHnc) [Formosa agariphila KMM 3901]